MKYVGLQTQIWRNNTKSLLLLIAFPVVLLALLWLFFFILNYFYNEDSYGNIVNEQFLNSAPFVLIFVGIWFLIAWLSHSSMIKKATTSKPLERKENLRVYNLVENLCISKGMKTPKIYVIDDDSLNAFASGLSSNTFAVSLSKGIINKLNDEELEAVIAHELTHIRNRDVRLLIVSIIFVGIFAFVAEIAFRSLRYSNIGGKNKKGGGAYLIVLLIIGIIGYLLSILLRFALSRKREFLADAGAVEMTKNSKALASALRKVSQDPWIEAVKREDVAQMFIEHPTKKEKSEKSMFTSIFATHPPIKKRIELLEQF